ncbi:MAG: hypothetical protein JXA78_12535 [Anaerolineales bacterium]|nr:hypothetical protein [Anaerolineales bacterium]
MRNLSHRILIAINSLTVVLLLLALLAFPGLGAQAVTGKLLPEDQAAAQLERMTPEERVGQLFLVTFEGIEVGEGTPIYELITTYNVGGVILLAKNNNFIDQGLSDSEFLRQILDTNHQLQQDEWGFSRQGKVSAANGEIYYPAYVPLIIGLAQEGDGDPFDQIQRGLTPLPNALTIGATWNPQAALQAGEILGRELSILGFNLLLGPSLDVLDIPQPEASENLGTRAFGGDPYWVSEMGRAYIRGVHLGSADRVAVVAKHFPGHGSSDRQPETEVATVRKSLDELKSFDLAPFFAVTGSAQAPEEVADALLVSHIRYQGLQGNIRATTRPVSLDPQAFGLLTGLPELKSWQQNGGVMISDNLGSQAVRRFYSLTNQTFDARRVALNAFLAGNDLLYFADFSSADIPDSLTAAQRTLEFFAQKYREDAAFAQRVDQSVLRILTLKFRLFQNFTLGNVLVSQGDLEQLGQSMQVTFEIARQGATLISPSQAELDDTIPDPPNQNDRIVFISDNRSAQQCSQCDPRPILPANALQDAVLRLYGPQAGGQAVPYNLSSYSLADLQQMLAAEPDTMALEADLKRANWIVFVMLKERNDVPSFQVLRQFLTERPNLFQQKRMIVFALCAPYYLDATNISKLTAYYGLYSQTPQFVELAAYLLFHELRPKGAPPVSVRGIDYSLNQALFPDPEQIIHLELDLPQAESPVGPTITPSPTPPPVFLVGDVIPIRTGIILDYNGNPVPDGTPVSFVFTIGLEANSTRQVVTTENGIARTTYAVNIPGALEIRAESENARSESIKLDIPSPSGEIVKVVPTETTTPTPEPTPTQEAPQPQAYPALPAKPTPRPSLGDWITAVLISGGIAWSAYRLAALVGQARWGLRAGFLGLIGGHLAYSFLALRLQDAQEALNTSATRSVILTTLAGTILGLVVVLSWRAFSESRKQDSSKQKKL